MNNENDLSDANRGRGGSSSVATSILGSLERLVETSFKSNNNAVTAMDYVAQQVMVAKRAFGADLTQVVMEPVNRMTEFWVFGFGEVLLSSEEPRSPFSGSARTVPRAQFSMGAHHRARALPAPKYYFFIVTFLTTLSYKPQSHR